MNVLMTAHDEEQAALLRGQERLLNIDPRAAATAERIRTESEKAVAKLEAERDKILDRVEQTRDAFVAYCQLSYILGALRVMLEDAKAAAVDTFQLEQSVIDPTKLGVGIYRIQTARTLAAVLPEAIERRESELKARRAEVIDLLKTAKLDPTRFLDCGVSLSPGAEAVAADLASEL